MSKQTLATQQHKTNLIKILAQDLQGLLSEERDKLPYIHENMLNITNHQGNAIQTYNLMLLHIY